MLRLRNGQRRLAYAVVNAINNTAKRIQEAERRRVEEEFTVRKRDFLRREAAKIKPFASVKQGRPYAEDRGRSEAPSPWVLEKVDLRFRITRVCDEL